MFLAGASRNWQFLAMPAKTSLLIASDHAGFELKRELQKLLKDITWTDLGPTTADRVDYPDFAVQLGETVAASQAAAGVLICGSGIGMSIAANKVPGIRAALVENASAARLAREHNNANVLCLGSRFLAPEYAAEIVQAWLAAQFIGGRHEGRLEKISKLEEKFNAK